MNTEIKHLKYAPSIISLFRTIQGRINNKFFKSLDIAIEGQMHENDLTSVAKEAEIEYEEPVRK